MATQPSLPVQTTARKWASINQANGNFEYSIEEMQVQVTAAQLLALKTTPINIVPAGQQVGEAIFVDFYCMTYTFKTTAYTLNAGTLKLFYGPIANAHPLSADLSTNFLTAAASRVLMGSPTLIVGPDTFTNNLSQGIFIGNDGGANYTLGDGLLTVTILYSKTTA